MSIEHCPLCGERLTIYRNIIFKAKMGHCKLHGSIPLDQTAIECPHCNRQAMYKFEFDIKNGIFFKRKESKWFCLHCESDFTNKNNKPYLKTGSRCYKCDGELGLLKDNSAWRCYSCNSVYANIDNSPEKPELCVKCGRRQLVKLTLQANKQYSFWICNHCKRNFADNKGTEL